RRRRARRPPPARGDRVAGRPGDRPRAGRRRRRRPARPPRPRAAGPGGRRGGRRCGRRRGAGPPRALRRPRLRHGLPDLRGGRRLPPRPAGGGRGRPGRGRAPPARRPAGPQRLAGPPLGRPHPERPRRRARGPGPALRPGVDRRAARRGPLGGRAPGHPHLSGGSLPWRRGRAHHARAGRGRPGGDAGHRDPRRPAARGALLHRPRRRHGVGGGRRRAAVDPRPAPGGDTVWSAVDAKPKSTLALRRLDNVRANPAASLLVAHYEDDWTRLWWVRLDGSARIVDREEERDRALGALATKYIQYQGSPPPGPVLALDVTTWRAWP